MSTIASRVASILAQEPERELFRFRDLKLPEGDPEREQSLTYAQAWEQASGFAEALSGLPAGARVLLILPLGPRLVAAHLGCFLAGAVPSIHSHPSGKVSPEVYARNLRHLIETLKPQAILTHAEYAGPLRSAAAPVGARVILEHEVPKRTPFEARAWRGVTPDQVALIQHSSGSTGLQKGVALTHAMVLDQCRCYASFIRVDPDQDRVASWIPLYHDMGLFTSWLLPLVERVPVVAIDPYQWVSAPLSFLELVSEHRATLAWQPNFAYSLLAARASGHDLTRLDLSSLRGLSSCSEPARMDSMRAFLAAFEPAGFRESALWVCYAMAENAFAVTATDPDRKKPRAVRGSRRAFAEGRMVPDTAEDAVELPSVGTVIEGTEIRVLGPEREQVPDGVVGEIAIRSDYRFDQYLENPEATRAAIGSDGWYSSGDLGFLWEGELYVSGRKKDLLIVAGRNFYPQDIEAISDRCAGAIPGRSVAIGENDALTGTQRVIVLIESHDSADPAKSSALKAELRRRVLEELDCPISEAHVVPHRWLIKTSSGKIARQPNLDRYRAEFARAEAASARPSAPGGRLSRALEFAAWSFVLALVAYLCWAFKPNVDWGVYAGFK